MWKVSAEYKNTKEEIRKIWKNIPADTAEHAIEFARILNDMKHWIGGKIYWPPDTHWTAEKEK